MKKIFFTIIAVFVLCLQNVYAQESQPEIQNKNVYKVQAVQYYFSDSEIMDEMKIQEHISNIGFKLLNANKIEKRMVFKYSKKDKLIKGVPELSKRQTVIYDKAIQYANSDDEVAALLAREIVKTAESYSGFMRGFVTSAQIKAAPKKYEIFFDKRAVDFMVNAGYNPVAMIVYINKAYPQKRFDIIGGHNLTSKRLANIYEYIYTKYPYFLKNNEYLTNEYYQNFLLTSQDNRKKLQEKIKSGSKEKIKYE